MVFTPSALTSMIFTSLAFDMLRKPVLWNRDSRFGLVRIIRDGSRSHSQIRANSSQVYVAFPALCFHFAVLGNHFSFVHSVQNDAGHSFELMMMDFPVEQFVLIYKTVVQSSVVKFWIETISSLFPQEKVILWIRWKILQDLPKRCAISVPNCSRLTVENCKTGLLCWDHATLQSSFDGKEKIFHCWKRPKKRFESKTLKKENV